MFYAHSKEHVSRANYVASDILAIPKIGSMQNIGAIRNTVMIQCMCITLLLIYISTTDTLLLTLMHAFETAVVGMS